MRTFARISPTLWQWPEVDRVGPHARLVLLYLLTAPTGSMVHAFLRLKAIQIADDVGIETEEAEHALEELTKAGLILRELHSILVIAAYRADPPQWIGCEPRAKTSR